MAGVAGRSGGHNKKRVADLRLTGGFRVSRHGGFTDVPDPTPAPVPKPTTLSSGAGKVWDELSGLCLKLGTLTPPDRFAFAVLCELLATAQRAAQDKDGSGALLPIYRLERQTSQALKPYLQMFGLSAGDRVRLRLPGPSPVKRNEFIHRRPGKWADLP